MTGTGKKTRHYCECLLQLCLLHFSSSFKYNAIKGIFRGSHFVPDQGMALLQTPHKGKARDSWYDLNTFIPQSTQP